MTQAIGFQLLWLRSLLESKPLALETDPGAHCFSGRLRPEAIMNGMQLYFRLIQISLLSRMQYRANFIAGHSWAAFLECDQPWIDRRAGHPVHEPEGLDRVGIGVSIFFVDPWVQSVRLFFSHTSELENYLIEGTLTSFSCAQPVL